MGPRASSAINGVVLIGPHRSLDRGGQVSKVKLVCLVESTDRSCPALVRFALPAVANPNALWTGSNP